MPRSSFLQKRAIAYGSSNKVARKSTLSSSRAGSRSFKNAVRSSVSGMTEKKAYQNLRNATILVSGTPKVDTLNAMAQGDEYDQRDGKQITMNGLTFSLVIAPNGTAFATSNAPTWGRWCIVLDRECKGAAPAWSDVYDISAGTDDMLAARLASNQDRFKVLREGTFVSNNYSLEGDMSCNIKEYIDMTHLPDRDRRVKFSGTAAGVASIMSNGLFLMTCISDQAILQSTALPYYTYGSRLTYTDA